jgi:hypothetical protein
LNKIMPSQELLPLLLILTLQFSGERSVLILAASWLTTQHPFWNLWLTTKNKSNQANIVRCQPPCYLSSSFPLPRDVIAPPEVTCDNVSFPKHLDSIPLFHWLACAIHRRSSLRIFQTSHSMGLDSWVLRNPQPCSLICFIYEPALLWTVPN